MPYNNYKKKIGGLKPMPKSSRYRLKRNQLKNVFKSSSSSYQTTSTSHTTIHFTSGILFKLN